MKKPRVSEQLYNRLPNIYRMEDAKVKGAHPLPLKRFLQVLGTGFDFMEDKIEGLINIYDIDNCPKEFLDKIVETMGFKLPYALPENEQRRFVKVLPYLYKTKGTVQSFEYLAREVFGTRSSIKAYKETYVEGMTPQEWRKIYVEVVVDGEQLNLGRREEYFKKFAELVRPVNTTLCTLLKLYYFDSYDFKNNVGEMFDRTTIVDGFNKENESYRYSYLVDGIRQPCNIYGDLLFGYGNESPIILNKSRTYNGQSIELLDRLSEDYQIDIFRGTPLNELYSKSHLTDLLDPSVSDKMQYENPIEVISEFNQDNLSIVVRDVFSRDYMKFDPLADSYRHRLLVDGEDLNDRSMDDAYDGTHIVECIEVLSELDDFDTIKMTPELDVFRKDKVRDNQSPITLNISELNDLNDELSELMDVTLVHTEEDSLRKMFSDNSVVDLKITNSQADTADRSNRKYQSSTEVKYTRLASNLCSTSCKLGAGFFTNDAQVASNLSF